MLFKVLVTSFSRVVYTRIMAFRKLSDVQLVGILQTDLKIRCFLLLFNVYNYENQMVYTRATAAPCRSSWFGNEEISRKWVTWFKASANKRKKKRERSRYIRPYESRSRTPLLPSLPQHVLLKLFSISHRRTLMTDSRVL